MGEIKQRFERNQEKSSEPGENRGSRRVFFDNLTERK